MEQILRLILRHAEPEVGIALRAIESSKQRQRKVKAESIRSNRSIIMQRLRADSTVWEVYSQPIVVEQTKSSFLDHMADAVQNVLQLESTLEINR
jgi:hypothetical protein